MRINVRYCLLLFMVIGFTATVKAQNMEVTDFVGRWKLVKVDEVRMQGTTELARTTYTPAQYAGKIFFEEVECAESGATTYGGKCDSGLVDGGNLQLNEGSNHVIFHGRQAGFHFELSWQHKPNSFILVQQQRPNQNQQSMEKKVINFYYERQ